MPLILVSQSKERTFAFLTDSSGTIANSYVYDAYGRTLTVFESAPQPFTYTGRERDAESGLYYYRARYYDPQTGRFLSEDPIGFDAGDQNLYRYVQGDPVNLTDPDGQIANVVVGFGVGVTVDLAFQLLENGANLGCLDFGRLLTAGAVGALGGVGFNALLPKIFSKLKVLRMALKGLSRPRASLSPKTINKVIESSRRPKGKDSFPRGLSKLQQRIRKTPEFKGEKPTQENAEKIIREILESRPQSALDSRGNQILRDPITKRAVRLDPSGLFNTLLGK